MKTLKQYFQEAAAGRWAIGHFNFSTGDQLRAIVDAAAESKSPVMVGTSEGEAEFIGYDQAVALVRSYQTEGHAVFLNADHHKSVETCQAALRAHYDTVLVDASKLPYEENVALTKMIVAKAAFNSKRNFNPANPHILVEGELGYLRGSSEVQESVEISPNDYTKPEQAADFITRTGVDRLAVVFGNIHGIVTEQEEHLDIEHLKKIIQAVPDMPLVLHGASGLPAEEIKMAIQNGIVNVHINTELRVAYHDELRKELESKPDETTPYKYLDLAFKEVKKMVKEKLELFGSAGKI
ncbi:MAG: ketose-bisphosphate aldolase [Patescibacteria group bacterium]